MNRAFLTDVTSVTTCQCDRCVGTVRSGAFGYGKGRFFTCVGLQPTAGQAVGILWARITARCVGGIYRHEFLNAAL